MVEKYLLSTDIGSDIDDAFSLLTIINSGMNINCIYTVNGRVVERAFIAKRLVDLARRDIEVCVGESEPIGGDVRPHSYIESNFVEEKYIDKRASDVDRDIVYRPVTEFGISPKGVKDMAERLSQEKYSIISIGPMTNLAKLLIDYPEVVKNVNHFYIMGCRFTQRNGLGGQEHNVRFDIPASKFVFESDVPITVIPGDLCEKYKLPTENIESLNSPAGKYVKRMAHGFLAAQTAQSFRSNRLGSLISDTVRPIALAKTDLSIEEWADKKDLEKLIVNLDDLDWGSYDPKEYFKQYNLLIDRLTDKKIKFLSGNIMASALNLAILREFHVADVYVPYVIQNSAKIKTVQGKVEINFRGESSLNEGRVHNVVTDIDIEDFKKFLRENLR